MQLGFVSAIFGDLSFEEVFKHAAAIGYDCVEVMCWPPGGPDRKYGGVMHLDVTDFSQAQADDTNALCEKYGVGISALGYYSIPLSAEADQAKAACEHLPKVIDAAAKLGLSNVNSFIGANYQLSLEDNLKKFTEVWPDFIRHAESRNIRIGIENCPMLFAETWPFGLNLARTPAIWRRMFEAIPSEHIGLNYDPSHLQMQLMDPIAPIREFGSRIFSRARQGYARRCGKAKRRRFARAADGAQYGEDPRLGRHRLGQIRRRADRRGLRRPRLRGGRRRGVRGQCRAACPVAADQLQRVATPDLLNEMLNLDFQLSAENAGQLDCFCQTC